MLKIFLPIYCLLLVHLPSSAIGDDTQAAPTKVNYSKLALEGLLAEIEADIKAGEQPDLEKLETTYRVFIDLGLELSEDTINRVELALKVSKDPEVSVEASVASAESNGD